MSSDSDEDWDDLVVGTNGMCVFLSPILGHLNLLQLLTDPLPLFPTSLSCTYQNVNASTFLYTITSLLPSLSIYNVWSKRSTFLILFWA